MFGCGIYSVLSHNDVLPRASVTSVHTLQLQSQFHLLPLTEESHCAESKQIKWLYVENTKWTCRIDI